MPGCPASGGGDERAAASGRASDAERGCEDAGAPGPCGGCTVRENADHIAFLRRPQARPHSRDDGPAQAAAKHATTPDLHGQRGAWCHVHRRRRRAAADRIRGAAPAARPRTLPCPQSDTGMLQLPRVLKRAASFTTWPRPRERRSRPPTEVSVDAVRYPTSG
jgi:hypothetical protein